LLKHEHVVVEELLQLLVTEVDTDLLETVELTEEKNIIKSMITLQCSAFFRGRDITEY